MTSKEIQDITIDMYLGPGPYSSDLRSDEDILFYLQYALLINLIDNQISRAFFEIKDHVSYYEDADNLEFRYEND